MKNSSSIPWVAYKTKRQEASLRESGISEVPRSFRQFLAQLFSKWVQAFYMEDFKIRTEEPYLFDAANSNVTKPLSDSLYSG